MTQPLYVAILWHMHQPLYKDGETGSYTAPWVRLHAVRDYLHMAEAVADYPNVHVTFNLVPSLLEQIADYASGAAVDPELALSRRESWSLDEKRRLLSRFFQVNDRVLARYPRYAQLKKLRDAAEGDASLFSDAFYRDIVGWFNLSWIDSAWIRKNPRLRALAERGHGFTLEDIRAILAEQEAIIDGILPAYRDLARRGHIEISTSPYYHPILPLLYSTGVSREVSGDLVLPDPRFSRGEDARVQLLRAATFIESRLGVEPKGLWPSEGAVSPAMLRDVAGAGFTWLASDEEVLARSLGVDLGTNPDVLYRPYRLSGDDHALNIVFRDRRLSDRIGFVYTQMDSRDAADDLIGRLRAIQARQTGPSLVTIALDGENCWDYYEENGDVFLRRLYAALNDDPTLRAVTVSEYLDLHPDSTSLPQLAAGTWVPGGFATWIGQPAQNLAWEMLARTREDLGRVSETNGADGAGMRKAWEEMYVSEGSDWFWWYFCHNVVDGRNPYDDLFRGHLRGVYRHAGLPVPDSLYESVCVMADAGA